MLKSIPTLFFLLFITIKFFTFIQLKLLFSTIIYHVASQEWCEFISEYECNDEK